MNRAQEQKRHRVCKDLHHQARDGTQPSCLGSSLGTRDQTTLSAVEKPSVSKTEWGVPCLCFSSTFIGLYIMSFYRTELPGSIPSTTGALGAVYYCTRWVIWRGWRPNLNQVWFFLSVGIIWAFDCTSYIYDIQYTVNDKNKFRNIQNQDLVPILYSRVKFGIIFTSPCIQTLKMFIKLLLKNNLLWQLVVDFWVEFSFTALK